MLYSSWWKRRPRRRRPHSRPCLLVAINWYTGSSRRLLPPSESDSFRTYSCSWGRSGPAMGQVVYSMVCWSPKRMLLRRYPAQSLFRRTTVLSSVEMMCSCKVVNWIEGGSAMSFSVSMGRFAKRGSLFWAIKPWKQSQKGQVVCTGSTRGCACQLVGVSRCFLSIDGVNVFPDALQSPLERDDDQYGFRKGSNRNAAQSGWKEVAEGCCSYESEDFWRSL
jgi:hypothetical protein